MVPEGGTRFAPPGGTGDGYDWIFPTGRDERDSRTELDDDGTRYEGASD